MILQIYAIGFIITAIWCCGAHFYYRSANPNDNFWKLLPIVTFGNALIFPLTWVVIISRYTQSKDGFNKNKFRNALEWIAMKLFGKLFNGTKNDA